MTQKRQPEKLAEHENINAYFHQIKYGPGLSLFVPDHMGWVRDWNNFKNRISPPNPSETCNRNPIRDAHKLYEKLKFSISQVAFNIGVGTRKIISFQNERTRKQENNYEWSARGEYKNSLF